MTERIRESFNICVFVNANLYALNLAVEWKIEEAFFFAVIHVSDKSESLVQVVSNARFSIYPLSVFLDVKVITT